MMEYEKKKFSLAGSFREAAKKTTGTVSLYKTTSNLFRSVDRCCDQAHLDVRDFNKVISIDLDKLVVDVEGMTTYADLVDETLKFSLMPAVVPQLKSITIGGAYAGGGIESSSFRYGLVHETIQEAEILLGSGDIVLCTAENSQKDLFYAFPDTYGSLGYALKVKARLVPAKKFVKISYQRFSAAKEFFCAMEKLCVDNKAGGSIDFIDGVVFSDKEMYLCAASFVDDVPYISDYTYMNIYYQSIRDRHEDYLTTRDYIWRWDADWFWCSKVFMMQNRAVRALLGKWMLSSPVYAKIMHTIDRKPWLRVPLGWLKGQREPVIQDIIIPSAFSMHFFEFYCESIGILPLWICPAFSHRRSRRFDFCSLAQDTLYYDFGFWDSLPSNKPLGYYNRLIEKKTVELEGFKSLYSTSYYTEDEFWSIFNRPLYRELKQRYDPHGRFKGLYEKVCGKR